jgi:hypothetical protein
MIKTIEKFNYYKDLLYFLSKSKPKEIKSILESVDPKFIQLLCETTHNLLLGNIPLNDEKLKQLKKYKTKIRKLCSKNTLETKKKLLGQTGGFLNVLIPALITGITSLIETIRKE